MRVKWQNNVFVRYASDESVVWCARTGGCTVLKNVQPILEEVQEGWREEQEILRAIAAKFGYETSDVFEDFYAIIAELVSQGFVMREGWKEIAPESKMVTTADEMETQGSQEEDVSPLGDFCARHDIPRDLHIDLTDACTERCVHCYVPQDQRNYLPYELVEKALREFRDMNGLTVHLTGGEAMLHPDFERICRLCVELNLNFIIFSNMTLCDEKRIALLKEVDPQFINVSLYSMNAAEHDAITCVPGSWQKMMDAILACEKAGVHCRIASPLLRENKDSFAELKRFAAAHHMHLVPSCDIVPRANHTCSNLDHACSAAELKMVLAGENKQIFDRGWDGAMPKPEDKVCDIGVGRIYLNAKGDYYPCDCMHEYVLGSVRDNTLQEIWRGEKLDYLRGLKNKNFGKCVDCEHRPWCKVCPAFNFNATGNVFVTIPEKCAQSAVIHKIYGGRQDADQVV